jgi:hypothetical protein
MGPYTVKLLLLGTPSASARYALETVLALNCACAAEAVALSLAASSTPEVFMSSLHNACQVQRQRLVCIAALALHDSHCRQEHCL